MVLLHSGFQCLLCGSDAVFVCNFAFSFVCDAFVAAQVLVVTPSGVFVSAIAFQVCEVSGVDAAGYFCFEVCIEHLAHVWESVVGHVGFKPFYVVLGLELFYGHPDGHSESGTFSLTEEQLAVLVVVSLVGGVVVFHFAFVDCLDCIC